MRDGWAFRGFFGRHGGCWCFFFAALTGLSGSGAFLSVFKEDGVRWDDDAMYIVLHARRDWSMRCVHTAILAHALMFFCVDDRCLGLYINIDIHASELVLPFPLHCSKQCAKQMAYTRLLKCSLDI